MARRQHRLSPDERKRARRVLVALGGAAAVVLIVSFLAWAPWVRHGDEGDHEHLVAPHGGTLSSVGVGDPHDHAEAVLGPGGSLTVYMLQPDAKTHRAIGRQVLTAWVRAAGADEPARVILMPMPQAGDPDGATSRFAGRLAESLWGSDLERVTVPQLAVAGGRYRLAFSEVKSSGDLASHRAEQRSLFLTPGGKYGRADIEANGNTTAARKFVGREAEHALAPSKAGWLCPVASARSEPGVSWIVGGQDYRFCCSPCVDEFVRLAKEQPERIKPPDAYRKP